MAKLSKLEERYIELSYEALTLFTSGIGGRYTNMDIMKYKSGTLDKINNILSRRNEIGDLLKEEDEENNRDARD